LAKNGTAWPVKFVLTLSRRPVQAAYLLHLPISMARIFAMLVYGLLQKPVDRSFMPFMADREAALKCPLLCNLHPRLVPIQ
jgi:hypothetical protein